MKKIWFYVALCCSLVVNISCLEQKKNIDEVHSVDYGSQSTYDDIVNAVNRVGEELSTEEIEVGQYAHYNITQQAIGTDSLLIGELYRLITSKEDKGTYMVYSGTELERTRDNNDQWIEAESPFTLAFKKTNLTALETPFSTDSTDSSITYHNLKITTKATAPPKKVQESENCQDILGCTIRVTEIRFDQIIWDSPIQKLQHYWVVSPDVPFLGFFIKNCITGQFTLKDDQKTILTQCSTLDNFTFH